MKDLYQNIFNSDLFTFRVGKDHQAIIVHSAAITRLSKALDAMVNNGMLESQTRSATLDDIDADDFIRFCQFAYTGDYATPNFTEDEVLEGGEMLTAAPPSPPIQSENEWAVPIKKRGKKGKPVVVPSTVGTSLKAWRSWGIDVSHVNHQDLTTLGAIFENRRFCKDFPRQELFDSCEPLSNSHANHNFTPVFLAHCRLYTFADKYGIHNLEKLALQKLHQTLVRFELHLERVGDLVELVRFAYTDKYNVGGGSDELRALVTLYMASRIDKLNNSSSFVSLLEDGGIFVVDFWSLVRNALYI